MGIHERVVRVPVVAGGVIAFLAVVFVILFSFSSHRVDCERGECVVTSRALLGIAERRTLPASSIRDATLGVSITHRAGASPGRTDTSLVFALQDGSTVQIDDASFAFLDASLGNDDVRAIDDFLASPTTRSAHVATGGTRSALAIIVVLSIAIAFIVRMTAFGAIDISTDDTSLVIMAPAENSHHPLANITGIGVARAYRSLRVLYADGSHQQGAKLGLGDARLDDLAKRTSELLGLPAR